MIIAAAYSLHSFSQSLTRTEGVMLRRNCLFLHRESGTRIHERTPNGADLEYQSRQEGSVQWLVLE